MDIKRFCAARRTLRVHTWTCIRACVNVRCNGVCVAMRNTLVRAWRIREIFTFRSFRKKRLEIYVLSHLFIYSFIYLFNESKSLYFYLKKFGVKSFSFFLFSSVMSIFPRFLGERLGESSRVESKRPHKSTTSRSATATNPYSSSSECIKLRYSASGSHSRVDMQAPHSHRIDPISVNTYEK